MKIIANGLYPLNKDYNTTGTTVTVTGTADSAVLSVVRYTSKGVKVNLKSHQTAAMVLLPGTVRDIPHRSGDKIYLEVSSAGGATDLTVGSKPNNNAVDEYFELTPALAQVQM